MTMDLNTLFQGNQPQAAPAGSFDAVSQAMQQGVPQTAPAPAAAPLGAPVGDVAAFMASTTEEDVGYDKALYFDPGYYPRCELLSVVIKTVEMRQIFIAEFMILKSTVESRPAGTQVSVVRPIEGKYAKSTAGECRKHLAKIVGCDWQQLSADHIRQITDPNVQPASGRLVEVTATLNKKETFTNVSLTSVPGSMAEHKAEAAQLRQQLGLAPF